MIFVGHGGLDPTHEAHGAAIHKDVHAGQQEGMLLSQFIAGHPKMQIVQQVFHHALEVGIIHVALSLRPGRVVARAVQEHAQHARFAGGGFRSGVSFKNIGKFKQPQTLRSLGEVVAQIIHEAGGQGGAQGILLRRERVHDGNAALARHGKVIHVLVAHKAVVHGFVEAKASAPVLEARPESVARFRLACAVEVAGNGGQHGGNGIQPVHAAHFFDQISFTGEVGPPGGLADAPHGAAFALVHIAAHAGEHLFVKVRAKLHTQQGIGPRRAEFNTCRLEGAGFVDGKAALHAPAADGGHHGAGAVKRPHGALLVDAALKAVGRFGREAQTARCFADGGGLEDRAFQKHIGAGIGNFAVQAAHNASKSHGASAVADAEVGCGERTFLPVKGSEGIAFLRAAHHDAAAFQLVHVKGVQGLTVFKQNIVGHVHDIGNGAHTHGMQAVTQAHGRRPDLDARDDAAGIQPAVLGIVNINGHQHFCAGVQLQRQFGDGERQVAGQGGFARKAKNRKAVGTVGRDGNIQHFAVKLELLHQRFAHHKAFGQHHNAGVVFGQAQFALGADHAKRRRSAQLGLFDHHAVGHLGAHQGHRHFLACSNVGCAANDIKQLALPCVHLADVQMVGFRMIVARNHMPHHNGAYGIVGPADVFQLKAEHGQAVAQRLSRSFIRSKFTQP